MIDFNCSSVLLNQSIIIGHDTLLTSNRLTLSGIFVNIELEERGIMGTEYCTDFLESDSSWSPYAFSV